MLLDFSIEALGAILFFPIFRQTLPAGRAIWYSIFHSVSAFNNAGFDIMGTGDSLAAYTDHVPFNLIVCALIILGGLGFFVLRELIARMRSRLAGRRPDRLSLHSKVVLVMTGSLLLAGTLLFIVTERGGMSLLGAFFSSVTTRTAGFSTYPMAGFSNAGLVAVCVLMFIGASPGSTGGGMKTTTIFVLLKSLISAATGKEPIAFGRKLKDDTIHRATMIVSLGLLWVLFAVILISALEPGTPIRDLLFEVTSAIGTVGLTTGVTPTLSIASKCLIMVTMYVGRLGPLTVATLWHSSKAPAVSRPEEQLPIG
jgi:trk system potassium uptake protein TrkH